MARTALRPVLLLAIAGALVQLLLGATLDLGLDEAYALAVSRQFQLSWFDHPPLTFWIVGGTQALFGRDMPPVLLRVPFIAMSTGATVLLYALTARAFGHRAGFWAAFLGLLSPFMFLSGGWLLPDTPLALFLLLCTLFLVRIVTGGQAAPHWGDWIGAGVALGSALLSKYHAGLFALGALAFFIASPQDRLWLRRPQPYAAAAIALALFFPVLLWNAENGWISFAYQLGRGAPGSAVPSRLELQALLELAYLSPAVAAVALVGVVVALATPSRPTLLFVALGLPTVIVFNVAPLLGSDTLAHWSMPGWRLLLPLAGALIAGWGIRLWRTLTGAAAVASWGAIVATVVVLLGPWQLVLAPDLDSFRVEAKSWTGVAEGLRANGLLAGNPMLVTGTWLEGARIDEALRPSEPVHVFSELAKGFAWLDDAGGEPGRDALIFTHPADADWAFPRYAPFFQSLTEVGRFPVQPGSSKVIVVTLARGLKQPFPLPYGRYAAPLLPVSASAHAWRLR